MDQLRFAFYNKKVCKKCGKYKRLKDFIADSNKPDGFRTTCKHCRNAYNRQHYAESLEFRMAIYERSSRYRSLNKERIRERLRQFYAQNKERLLLKQKEWRKANPVRSRNIQRRWQKANPEKIRAGCRKWRKTYPEKMRASVHKWQKANPEKVREISRRRRARKLSAAGNLTAKDECRLYELYDHCLCCGTTNDLSIDHIVPLAKGGSDSFDNCQVLCRLCNSKKHIQIIDYRPKLPAPES